VTDDALPDAPLDLDGVERDLADVEIALERLDAGTYWSDEDTGEPLDDELLARRPTARRPADG
jgi:RNA polymerase-binding transcription factor DksA